jgi:interferon, gamma-inducible protein 30
MADPRRLHLLAALLLAASLAPAVPEAAGKVSLELYYESLCPYCSRFIVNRLAGVFKDGLIDAVDLRLVPYGNARVGSNGEISCQVNKRSSKFRLNLSFGFSTC